MTGVNADNIESKMEGITLADKKALSAKKKARFTRHDKDCAHTIKLWQDNPTDKVLANRARKQYAQV